MIQRIETWENGILLSVEEVEVPDPPANNDIISAVSSMTPEELDALRQILGIA